MPLNQEKALVGAFSVILKTSCNLREDSFEALPRTCSKTALTAVQMVRLDGACCRMLGDLALTSGGAGRGCGRLASAGTAID